MDQSCCDYISHLRDEISLEGLDGITLEALWLRLSLRYNFASFLPLDDNSKKMLWTLVTYDEEMRFYKLQKPRSNLKIFNRYDYIDDEMGMILEPRENFEDIYPCCEIEDELSGIRGSCSTYKTRVDITEIVNSLSLVHVKKEYGNSLVIVASQMLRNKALSINTAIDKFYNLTLIQYIMLERIGRSRNMGEITYGKNSLACLKCDAKTMYYYRKRLLKLKIITKQDHQQRTVKGSISSSSLLHLTRFTVKRKSKFVHIIQQVIDILKDKPKYSHPLSSVKAQIGFTEVSSKKIFKNSEFLKYIRTIVLPYRQVYENATVEEWRYKVKDEEKSIKCLQLINPNVDSENVCTSKEETEFGEDGEDDSIGILDQSKILFDISTIQQAYMAIESAGPNGMSQIELAKYLGQTKLDSRTICRNLLKRNVIHSLMKDIGRQRVTRFVSNKFISTGHLLQEFETERKKMIKIVESTNFEVEREDFDASTQELSNSRLMESDPCDDDDVIVKLKVKFKGTEMLFTWNEEINEKMEQKLENLQIEQESPHRTTKDLKRGIMLMNEVKKYKIVDDTVKLQKMITESEAKEGLDGKMDKKSLWRLMKRIADTGSVKIIDVSMLCGTREKSCTFIADKTVTLGSSLLKSTIEKHKHKFLIHAVTSFRKESVELSHEPSSSLDSSFGDSPSKLGKDYPNVKASTLELQQMQNIPIDTKLLGKPDSKPFQKLVGIKGQVAPKFKKIKEFHKLLFYLIYGYEGDVNLDQGEAWYNIIKTSSENLSLEDIGEYSKIYFAKLDYRMFISPLPRHVVTSADADSMDGWAFVVEVMLRLPLSIYVQLLSMSCSYSLLDSYLNHPIKRHILIKDLPPELRKFLLKGRRYVTYIIELCHKLCYMGLAQRGSQISKEKDQLWLYLNKCAILVDTTTSKPGYHHISMDNEYVRTLYRFETLENIDFYWLDLETICMHTHLGGHSCVEGTSITVMTLEKKRSMIECLREKKTKEAQNMDVGFIPGDGKGAAGLDSAMYAHLKRNWFINSRISNSVAVAAKVGPEKYIEGEKIHSYAQYLKDSCQPSCSETSSAKQLPGIRNVRLSLYKPSKKEGSEETASPVTVFVGFIDPKMRQKKTMGRFVPKTSSPVSNRMRKRESYEREVKVREKRPRKPYHDEKDKAALRRMNKLRVEWYPAEDSVLLLCKVASLYLFPNKRLQVVNFSVVRDILHSRFPESRNKTSKACQRRILYMMKNSTTEENVAIILEELKQDTELSSEFKPQKIPLNPSVIIENYSLMFTELVNRLILKLESNKSQVIPELPSTLLEFDQRFKIIRTSSSIKLDSKLGEITTTRDIDHYVFHALLFSSLCTMQDRESWAYQLYLAYQKYPQSLMNSVLTFIRDSKMISYKKAYNRSTYSRQCLPLSTSPFQLSLSFIYTFHMKYHYDIFSECWDLVKQLLSAKQKMLTDIENELKSSSIPSSSEPNSKKKRGKKNFKNRKAIKKEPSEYDKIDDVENSDDVATYEDRIRDLLRKRLLDEKGVEVVIHQEGGYCAAVASLMATKRVLFDIIIPEQIIMIDKNQSDKEGRQKLMQKILYHEEVSGRKFELPPELQHREKDNSPVDEDIYLDYRPAKSQPDNDNPHVENNLLEDSGSSSQRDISPKKICIVEDDKSRISGGNSDKLKNKVTFDNEINLEDLNSSRNADDSSSPENEVDDSDFDQPMDLSGIEEANDPLNLDSDAERGHLTDCEKYSFKRKNPDDIVVSKRRKLVDETNNSNGDVIENVALTVDSGLTETENISNVKVRRSKQHSRSRLNMYMMREQLVNQYESNYPQWEKDNVLINACEVSCRLRLPPDTEHSQTLPSSIDEISKVFLTLSQDKIEKALIKRKRVILRDWIKFDTAIEILFSRGESANYLRLATNVYNYIESSKEFGASAMAIKNQFNVNEEIDSNKPMKIVNDMENLNLILRVGIETWKWVTIQHSKIWLIRTNKVSRNKMKTMESVRKTGVYEITEHDNETEIGTEPVLTEKIIEEIAVSEGDSQPVRGTKRTRAKMRKEKDSNEKLPTEMLNNQEVLDLEGAPCTEVRSSVTRHSVRSKLALRNHKYRKETPLMANVEKNIESEIPLPEEIDVLVRPWVRLNGCLNRRVMDRFLGSVLSFVMESPGTNGKSITDRFWPALQPAHTYELLETLEDIESITRTNIIKSNVITLFSTPQIIEEESVESYDFDENFSYHATVDAILKLSMFIGDKKYGQEFLANCRKK